MSIDQSSIFPFPNILFYALRNTSGISAYLSIGWPSSEGFGRSPHPSAFTCYYQVFRLGYCHSGIRLGKFRLINNILFYKQVSSSLPQRLYPNNSMAHMLLISFDFSIGYLNLISPVFLCTFDRMAAFGKPRECNSTVHFR